MRSPSSIAGRPRRLLAMEALEGRRLLSGLPLGALPADTGEFMLGSVAVTPVLLESNGLVDPSSENWDTSEVQQVIDNLVEGLQWWVDTLATFDPPPSDPPVSPVHSLEFIVDDTYAIDRPETPFEPISRISDSYVDYVGRFLADLGYDASGLTLEQAMRDFNHSQREKLGTDWSFTIFVVDSSNDSDGEFAPGGTFRRAFAFAGGLFFITPSVRPASTYAHETGHMFWARDEYPNSGEYTDVRGYYNTQNTNAVDGAPDGFVQEPSIMTSGSLLETAYLNNISAASTLAQVGWQDSDGDGLFDVLDVPLDLDVAAVYRRDSGLLEVRGTASAVALPNLNSSGLANDITLNEISRLEMSVDGGPWNTIATPGQQVAEIDLSMLIPSVFGDLRLRAIDDFSRVTSNVVTVTPDRPTGGDAGAINAYAFVDENENSTWDAGEFLVSGIMAEISNPESLYRGRVEPDDTAGTVYAADQDGFKIRSEGNQVDGRVAAFTGKAATGTTNFQYGSLFGNFGQAWTAVKQELEIGLDQPTTDASIIAIGLGEESFGRLDGYDVNDNLVARATGGPLAEGETTTLRIHDPEGRIARVRAYGTARTNVALDDFRYGPVTTAMSGTFGVLEFGRLPDGTYDLDLQSTTTQFEVIDAQQSVEVMMGSAAPLAIPVRRVTSRWTNPINPLDVNDNQLVQPLDALVVINDLNRNGPRALGDSDSTPPYLDVNGDLSVTPIDALRVINFLNRGQGDDGGAVGGEGEFGAPLDFGPSAPADEAGRSDGEGENSSFQTSTTENKLGADPWARAVDQSMGLWFVRESEDACLPAASLETQQISQRIADDLAVAHAIGPRQVGQ